MTPDPITILVAEGDAVLRGGTGLLLGKAGYVVREAAGGEAALASMAASVPDLLLLDRDLPDLDGLEVCRRVKADATARDCFVLLASGSSVAPEEPAEGLEAGADGYIARPVANRELLARIDAYVRIIRLRKTLRLQNEALVRTSEAAAAARSSSLKLTEDAVAARERVEALNRVLLYEISERKRAEASLRDAASLLREAQAIAGLGSYTLNVSAGTWQSSEVMDRVLGLDAKSDRSVAGWLALIHPEDQAPLRDYLLHTVLEQGEPFDREYRIIRQSDQSERWVWGLGKLERDAAGHIVRMNGTIQDITERKRSQLELEHQSHLRAALLEMPAAAESMDEMAFLQHGQELAENLTGSGISFIRFVPEDQTTAELTVRSRRTREQYDHVANGPHDPVHQAGLWADAVRERRPVMLNHAPSPADHPGLPDGPAELTRLLVIPVVENNRVVMVAGVGNKPTDYLEVDLHRMQLISESLWRLMQRRRTKAQLQKLSRVVEQSPTSIVITDLGGSIEYVNPWFSTLTGYSAKDMLGQNPRVLQSGKTPPEVYGDMWRTLTAGRTWRGELINRKKNGEIYAELAVIAPVFGTDGKPTHYVAIKDDITARKQDELKLAAKEREQRLLIDHLSSGLIVYEADAGVVQTNPMAEAMLGLDAAAMLGKKPDDPLWRFYAEDGSALPPDQNPVSRVLATGDPLQGLMVGIRRPGQTDLSWVLCNAHPVPDPDGRLRQVVVNFIDLTERRHATDALRESEERFRELFDLESDAIIVNDVESGRIVQANRAAGLTYGLTVAQLLERSITDISAELHATVTSQRELRAIEGQVVRVQHRRHRRSDGSIFPVEISLRAFHRDGRLLVVAAIRDITAQVQARDQLEQFNADLEEKVAQRTVEIASRNHEMQALMQAVPDLVLRMNRSGAVIGWQPARGSTPLAALTPQVDLAPGGIAEGLTRDILSTGRQAIQHGELVATETEIGLNDRPFSAELRASPINGEEFVVFVRDITGRKAVENKLADMLEKERQLSDMKSRFISVTSHEFRTPLAAAMGSAELLHHHYERLLPPKREELFKRIASSMSRMTEMLDEILTLSRVEAAKESLIASPINLTQYLQGLVEEVRLGDHAAHRFEVLVEGDGTAFASDPKLLHHLVANLLSNAARYSPAGTVITVRLAVDENQAVLMVEDQGIGIPESDRPRIFGTFERGSNVGSVKGTGLGLSIVKRITGLLGGSIAFAALPDRGTRFTVHLPRGRAAPP